MHDFCLQDFCMQAFECKIFLKRITKKDMFAKIPFPANNNILMPKTSHFVNCDQKDSL